MDQAKRRNYDIRSLTPPSRLLSLRFPVAFPSHGGSEWDGSVRFLASIQYTSELFVPMHTQVKMDTGKGLCQAPLIINTTCRYEY